MSFTRITSAIFVVHDDSDSSHGVLLEYTTNNTTQSGLTVFVVVIVHHIGFGLPSSLQLCRHGRSVVEQL